MPGWDLEQTKKDAEHKWEKILNTIQIKTNNKSLKRSFYSALYHLALHPTNRTNENPLWKSKEPYYDDYYAIWDTFRATHPLFTLIMLEEQIKMIRSLIDIYKHEGYMPDSRSGNSTGRTQGGSNSDVIIADAFVKGLKGIDYEEAF